jgi:kumamolisin
MAQTHVILPHSHRAPVPGSTTVGDVDPNQVIEISVEVKGRADDELNAEFQKMQDQHASEHAYLSHSDVEHRFGANREDLQTVANVAARYGVTVISQNAAEETVKLRGTIANLTKMFPTQLKRKRHARHGEYRERTGDLQIPAELEGIVVNVEGFDTRRVARSHHIRRVTFDSEEHMAATRATHSHSFFTPPELGTIYDFPAGDGSGQCIGIFEFGGGFDDGDLTTYFHKLNIAKPNVVAVSVNGQQNNPNSPDPDDQDANGEVMLDIEVAGALAPKATLAVYFAPFIQRGWVDAIKAAISDTTNKPSVISISWGFAELQNIGGDIWTRAGMNSVARSLKKAALLGITVCVASGDDGSTDGIDDGKVHVDYPASDIAVLGCGGTTLKANAGHTGIVSEVVWSGGTRATGTGSTGGGVSEVWPKPQWQPANVPKSLNAPHFAGRGVPDVAADADPNTGYKTLSNHQWGITGGTSAVAPLFAALIARVNQTTGRAVGYINPTIYNTTNTFNDITHGNNNIDGVGYSARSGWDPCTGMGTPIGKRLLAALTTSQSAAA